MAGFSVTCIPGTGIGPEIIAARHVQAAVECVLHDRHVVTPDLAQGAEDACVAGTDEFAAALRAGTSARAA